MQVFNWLDGVIIAIILYTTARGFIKGLILSLTSLLSLVVGLLVAIRYQGILTDYLTVVWQLDKKLLPFVSALQGFFIPTKSYPAIFFTVDQAEKSQSISTLLMSMLQKLSLCGQTTIAEALNLVLVKTIISVLSFILLLLVTSFIFRLLGTILHSIFDWSFLAPINRIGGILLGCLRGVLIVLVFFALLLPFQLPTVLLGGETSLLNAVNNSYLAPVFWKLIVNSYWSPAGEFLNLHMLKQCIHFH